MPYTLTDSLHAGSRALRLVAASVKDFDEELGNRLDAHSHLLEAFALARELPSGSQFPRPLMEEIGRSGISLGQCGNPDPHRPHDWLTGVAAGSLPFHCEGRKR